MVRSVIVSDQKKNFRTSASSASKIECPTPRGVGILAIMAAQTFADAVAAAATDPCPVCFGDMKTSVKNECGHSVCFSCQIELHRRGQSLCPQCRAPCAIPDNFGPPAAVAVAPTPARAAAPTTVRHCSVCDSTTHNKRYHWQFRHEAIGSWHYRLLNYCASPVLSDSGQRCAIGWRYDGTKVVVWPNA